MSAVSAASDLLKPYDARLMRCYPISTRSNHVGNDREECTRRVEPLETQNPFDGRRTCCRIRNEVKLAYSPKACRIPILTWYHLGDQGPLDESVHPYQRRNSRSPHGRGRLFNSGASSYALANSRWASAFLPSWRKAKARL